MKIVRVQNQDGFADVSLPDDFDILNDDMVPYLPIVSYISDLKKLEIRISSLESLVK